MELSSYLSRRGEELSSTVAVTPYELEDDDLSLVLDCPPLANFTVAEPDY